MQRAKLSARMANIATNTLGRLTSHTACCRPTVTGVGCVLDTRGWVAAAAESSCWRHVEPPEAVVILSATRRPTCDGTRVSWL